ncbi:hypothetical protein LCGC14_1196420 [marine sediment metagenome]|uniref:Uncharacterized protein n=1 Tax=marine sediment metagenome TaxID=412755 RepID=A0A0F9LMM5_9ZZZZ
MTSSYKAKGNIIVCGSRGMVEHETLQCVHCQRHWVKQPGSGNKRGFCRNCMGPLCGDEKCGPCIPFEKKLDLYEAGRLAVLR